MHPLKNRDWTSGRRIELFRPVTASPPVGPMAVLVLAPFSPPPDQDLSTTPAIRCRSTPVNDDWSGLRIRLPSFLFPPPPVVCLSRSGLPATICETVFNINLLRSLFFPPSVSSGAAGLGRAGFMMVSIRDPRDNRISVPRTSESSSPVLFAPLLFSFSLNSGSDFFHSAHLGPNLGVSRPTRTVLWSTTRNRFTLRVAHAVPPPAAYPVLPMPALIFPNRAALGET